MAPCLGCLVQTLSFLSSALARFFLLLTSMLNPAIFGVVLALDDDELEEGEEELKVVRFAGLLFKSPPRLLHYIAPSLPPTYQDEEGEDKVGKDIRGELALLPKVGE